MHRVLCWVFCALPLFSQSQGFRVDAVALSPGQPVHTGSFTLEAATSWPITVAVTSTQPGVVLTVTTPAGEAITAQNVESLGGTHFEANLTEVKSSLLPFLPGHRVHLEFPQQGVGLYTVRVDGASLTEEAAVVLELPFNSQLSVNVDRIFPEFAAGESVPLSVGIRESGQPLLVATAFAEVSRDGGPTQTVPLSDDGVAPDQTAGDGVHAGSYSPVGPGDYTVNVWASGQRANGEPFRQGSPQKFKVHPVYAQLTGSHQDRGVDEDGDGRFDRVDLTFEVEVTQPGTYDLIAEVRSAAGASHNARGFKQTLEAGTQTIVAPVPLEDLRTLGDPGPYTIGETTLTWAPSGAEWIRVHRLADLGKTQAYAVQDLNPFPASYRSFSESAVDTDNDGTFDELIVEIEVDVTEDGIFNYALALISRGGQPAAAERDLPFQLRAREYLGRERGVRNEAMAGIVAVTNDRKYLKQGTQKLAARLFGPEIRRSGVNGPYAIGLRLSTREDQLAVGEIGETRAYRADQFDGLTPRISNIEPAVLQPGEERSILLDFKEVKFNRSDPPSLAMGPGVTVTEVEVIIGGERLSARVVADPNAAIGPRDVTVTGPDGSFTAPGALTLARPPRILSITPKVAELGETLEIAIEAENTSFTQGVTQVEFTSGPNSYGAGIEVRNVQVLDADSLKATISINPRAATHFLYLTAATDAETAAMEVDPRFSFRVQDTPALGSISPMQVRRGESLSVAVSARRIDLESGPITLDFGEGVAIESVEGKGERVTAQIRVAPDAPLGERPTSLETSAGKWTLDLNSLKVLPAPRVLGVEPASAAQGESVVVTMRMEGTLFGWQTKVSAGEGIYVRDIESHTGAEVKARFTIDPTAPPGSRKIRVSDERDTMELDFAVTPGR